jgi:hypothetical protein
MTIRRQFDLLPKDREFLDEYGLHWETIVDGSQWVLIHEFPVPIGYNHASVTAAIRVETGYPNTQLDMVYFFPALTRENGTPLPATGAQQPLDGKSYQRWSRHRTPANPWKAGRDDIGTHVILIEDWLDREVEKCDLP